jgi:peptidyl-tRNA hydrolase, PTH1 family
VASEGASAAPQPIKLIVALGNPGREHVADRHNAGFHWLQLLCDREQVTLRAETKFHSQFAKLTLNSQAVFCLAPQTYMNASGRAVAAVAKFYKISAPEILVVYDELDLPPGCARFKFSGGHGGHNGVRDIAKALGTKDFWRLRLGIGHPGNARDVSAYVLSSASRSDMQQIEVAMDDSLRVLDEFVVGNADNAILQLHTDTK